jgi:hypothetical protein
LRRKVLNLVETLNSAEKQLNDPVPRTCAVSGQLVASKLHFVVGEATLLAPITNKTSLAVSSRVVLWVVRYVKVFILRIALEALLAVPSDVLQGKKRAVRWEQEVQPANTNDGVVGVFNDALENIDLRRSGRSILVVSVRIAMVGANDLLGCALVPVDMRRVKRILDVSAVEVYLCTGRRVITL